MISIDNAQNEIGLPGHIDDGREWTEWLLKKADESKKTQVIPWVSIQNGMPVDDDGFSPLCLVYYTYTGGYGQPITSIGYDWWDSDKDEWMEHDNSEVTHWCYMDDIPVPVTERGKQ
ncbi:hypothetical protein ACNFJN_08145 [Xenorhabdus budapestensis]|uniref:hypothetical protein n=1 Tax=Xenorhabdus budapestensis TaxID=290110 RepID=UPI003A8AD3A7